MFKYAQSNKEYVWFSLSVTGRWSVSNGPRPSITPWTQATMCCDLKLWCLNIKQKLMMRPSFLGGRVHVYKICFPKSSHLTGITCTIWLRFDLTKCYNSGDRISNLIPWTRHSGSNSYMIKKTRPSSTRVAMNIWRHFTTLTNKVTSVFQ